MSAGSHRSIRTRVVLFVLVGLVATTFSASRLAAHCQVPCGIYDDDGRISMLLEDTRTIQKAMTQIQELSGKHDAQSLNQLNRWIQTKEDHASHIIKVVSEYFLTQKVKPVAAGENGRDEYLAHLADHHAVMRAAMVTKQKVDPAAVATLQKSIEALSKHYMR